MSDNSLTSGCKVVDRKTGYFGKIPVRGDFLSHRLPPEFLEPWEDWVRISLETSRQQFGSSWLEYYLTSPIWHFALSPAICGDASWIGVFMPSVDAVGRYFPLTIAAPAPQEPSTASFLDYANTWFTKAECLAHSCLDDNFDLVAFEEAIVLLSAPESQISDNLPIAEISGDNRCKNAWRISATTANDLSLVYPRLQQKMLSQLFSSYSLWRTAGSGSVAPSYLITQGLPPPEGYAAMLDGDWRRWGWGDV